MRVLVTFAVDTEFAPWRKLREFVCVSKVPFEIYDTRLQNHVVRVLLTGIGGERARRAANAVMEDVFDVCISSGLVGGLTAEQRIGDILAFHDVAEVKGEQVISSSTWLVDQARRNGAKVTQRLMTSKRLIVTAQEKGRLGTFGDAVDMETFRIMAAAQGRGIPALALRAVSDAVNEDLPMDFSKHVSDTGQIAMGKVLGKLVLAPQVIPAMVRLGARTKRTVAGLAEFLDSLVSNLTPPVANHRQEVVAR
jgi:adenosylhomocysteine nucleosidase